ncbi:putative reverse transcriptase [Candidatus Termititenax persephonae]|uniref:Reverse transcriptase n=1 Tax=Candidatus Termititenax persephonae TaxID=2218525 RepID=A0A388TGR1_9BACT|nr:putative reverse transcriptase [Candidatus Termititenax persephonae]
MNFDNYFTRDKIIQLLCKYRAKVAKNRHKKHIRYSLSTECYIEPKGEIYQIMPPRRMWHKFRFKEDNKEDSVKYTRKVIYKTIKYTEGKFQNNPLKTPPEWFDKLNLFIDDIVSKINSDYKLGKPHIYLITKDKTRTEYRPLSQYALAEKVIISVTAKYLTEIFDCLFLDCSYAFRLTKSKNDSSGRNHHATIPIIQEYRQNNGANLWVAECDIRKFYDCVNHKIIRKTFRQLEQQKKSQGILLDRRAKKIFYKYVASYSYMDVLDKATQESRLDKLGFVEVAKELKKIYHCQNKIFSYKYIGVSQGGELSGLIANIVLHNTDITVSASCAEFHYLRFCDDMILLSPDKTSCSDIFSHYTQSVRNNLLAIHEPKELITYTKDFWKTKSKAPYLWAANNFPWVAFVGYQIKYDGSVRIAKKSIDKQKDKIIDVLNEYKLLLTQSTEVLPRVSLGYIKNSIEKCLISLSVGRTRLYNYRKYKPVLCWIAGFKAVTRNPIFFNQLKKLDHYKASVLRKFFKFLDSNQSNFPSITAKNHRKKKKSIKYYGRPFSYHGAIENDITIVKS